MTKVIPLNDRVLVRPDKSRDQTPGGILLPDNAKEKPQRGTVIEVGPGRLEPGPNGPVLIPVRVGVGDTVLYSRYAGSAITKQWMPKLDPESDDDLIITESEIIAVIRETVDAGKRKAT